MKTYKIAGQDYAPEEYEIAAMAPIMYAAFRSAVQAQGGALETGITTESLAALMGAIVSRLPALKTNRDKRVMTEVIGDRIMEYAKRFSDDAERNGEHILDVMGKPVSVPEGVTRQ